MAIDFIAINFDPGPHLSIQYPNCCPLLSVWPNLSYSQDGRGVQYQFEFIPGRWMEECVFIVCQFCVAIIKQLDIPITTENFDRHDRSCHCFLFPII